MAWAYAADSAQTTHAGYRGLHVVCEAWMPLHTDDKLYIYIYFYILAAKTTSGQIFKL